MIYIDTPRKCKYGMSSHMISNTSTEELINFGKKIGLKEKWLQKRGKHDEHYDVMNTLFQKAINKGAKLVESFELAKITLNKIHGEGKN